MPRHTATCAALLAAALALAPVPAQAATYTETTDAGDLIGTATNVGPGINQITGNNATGGAIGEVDVFKLTLPGGFFAASVSAQSGDMAMVLFTGTGIGLRADDDSGPGFQPLITFTLVAGDYYLGIFPAGDYASPNNAIGQIWQNVAFITNFPPNGPGANSPWTGWTANSSTIDQGGTYTIDLNQTTVGETTSGEAIPEPASLGLLATALLTLSAARRRTRHRA